MISGKSITTEKTLRVLFDMEEKITPERVEYLLKKWSPLLDAPNPNSPKAMLIEPQERFPVIVQGAIHYIDFFDDAIELEPAKDEYHEPTVFFNSRSHSFRMDIKAARTLHRQLGEALEKL